jgi:hypothetical protein
MKRDARTATNAAAKTQQPQKSAEAAVAAVHAATLAIHGLDACSHPAFDALTEASRELLLGLVFHAIDDTERHELDALVEQVDAAKTVRDNLASRATELRRRLGVADEDTRSLERMLGVLEAIERHSATLERIRVAVEQKAEYGSFLDSFGGRVLAAHAEWRRCLEDVDAAVAAARALLRREYDESQSRWTAIEERVLKS